MYYYLTYCYILSINVVPQYAKQRGVFECSWPRVDRLRSECFCWVGDSVCYSVLQFVAVCCSVLQYVAVSTGFELSAFAGLVIRCVEVYCNVL